MFPSLSASVLLSFEAYSWFRSIHSSYSNLDDFDFAVNICFQTTFVLPLDVFAQHDFLDKTPKQMTYHNRSTKTKCVPKILNMKTIITPKICNITLPTYDSLICINRSLDKNTFRKKLYLMKTICTSTNH